MKIGDPERLPPLEPSTLQEDISAKINVKHWEFKCYFGEVDKYPKPFPDFELVGDSPTPRNPKKWEGPQFVLERC